MSRSYKTILIALLILVASCKKKDGSETDNLFKFKDYISYHTNGNQSISTPITIALAQQLEQFELTDRDLQSWYFELLKYYLDNRQIQNITKYRQYYNHHQRQYQNFLHNNT